MEPKIIASFSEKLLMNDDIEFLNKYVKYGITHFRFNMSRIENDDEVSIFKDRICKLKEYYEESINIIVDLPYPNEKIRIFNKLIPVKEVQVGEIIIVESENSMVHIDGAYVSNIKDINYWVKEGQIIIYGDGEVLFKCLKIDNVKKNISLIALNYGEIRHRKAISFGKQVKSHFNENDIKNILKDIKVDAVALSFVSSPSEIIELQDFAKERKIEFFSKIETQIGVNNIREISKISNIMLGRGDLLLNSKAGQFFDSQLEVIKVAKSNNKKVIVATGIMQSLSTKYIPNQAELIDLGLLKKSNVDYIVLNHSLVKADHFEDIVRCIRAV